MNYIREFLKAVLAGACIGLGGICFLSIDNKIVGALFFTIGLFTICCFGFNLFTGKVCYLFDNKPKYLINLVIIWLGNLAGTFLTALIIDSTRVNTEAFAVKAMNICDAKLNDNLLSVFLLAVLCNILIFIAVDGFKNNPHEIGKYVGLFLGVAGFILCGFEHCVANMFYFAVAGELMSFKTIGYLLIMTLGNSVGGLIIPVARKYVIK